MQGTILIVDDQESIRHFLGKDLEKSGHTILSAATGAEAKRLVVSEEPDVAIVDIRLPDTHGLDLLRELREAIPGLQVVIITAFSDVESAVQAMKRGAFDYIPKPVHLDQLHAVIDKALAAKRVTLELSHLREARRKDLGLNFVESRNPKMLRLLDMAMEVAKSGTTSVLIEGESGTGKEVIANIIHRAGPSASMPFLEMNCASLPEKLLESELFGHEKGAFTDATTQKKGLLELADGGTLFLDEVGEMAPGIQVKLLRVLERMNFKRVGGTRDIQVQVRVISATNRELRREVAEGRFREDLYYRLKVVPFLLPPLRERAEDIIPLGHNFRERFNQAFGKSFERFSQGAEQMLLAYPWPGNIRELKNMLERAILLGKGSVLDETHLSLETPQGSASRNPIAATVERLLSAELPMEGMNLERIVEEIERAAIMKASEQAGWNQSRTSALLGINRDKLRYRMKLYGIGREQGQETGEEVVA
ncbi:MAG: sigma-54-dependent transcriptional regulator [bacterium]